MLIPLEGETISIHDFVYRKGKRKRFHSAWGKLIRHPNRQKKHKGQNRHHLLNKCRRGSSTDENLLWTDIGKHNLIHQIFRNDDPEYVILVLDRMMRMKHYRRFRGVHVTQEGDRKSA